MGDRLLSHYIIAANFFKAKGQPLSRVGNGFRNGEMSTKGIEFVFSYLNWGHALYVI